MSKKQSAYQVYAESRRQAVPARSPVGTTVSSRANDWRVEDARADRQPARRSPSPALRHDQGYNDYRDDSRSYAKDLRYAEDVHNSSSRRQDIQSHYDDQYDRRSWSGDDKRDYGVRNTNSGGLKDTRLDYSSDGSDRGGNYVRATARPAVAAKPVRRYSDSEDERYGATQKANQYVDDRGWSTDEDYSYSRKRRHSEDDYRRSPSPTPTPAKVWKERRSYSSDEERHNSRRYSNYDALPLQQATAVDKKVKGKLKEKGKGKTQKMGLSAGVGSAAPKILSLLDIKIPDRVKKQVDKSTANSAELGRSRLGESHSKLAYEDRRKSGYRMSDDHRGYKSSDDDYSRDKGRSGNNADTSQQRRKRQASGDWSRGSNRQSQKARSPVRSASESEQDSDREGGRRSWRDERRDRPLKKSSDKKSDKNHKDASGNSQKNSGKSTREDRSKKTSTVDRKERRESGDKGTGKAVDREAKKGKWRRLSGDKSATGGGETGRVQVIAIKQGLAVLLSDPVKVCMRGRCRVKVLAGAVSVMGYTMRSNPDGASREYDLYSPLTTSHLTISSVASENKQELQKALKSLNLEDKARKELTQNGGVLLLATRLEFTLADFLSTLAPFTQVFRYSFDRHAQIPSLLGGRGAAPVAQANPDEVAAAFSSMESGSPSSSIKTSKSFEAALEKWKDTLKDLSPAPIVVLCGGVNSGKSTFSRFMINTALSVVSKVGYFDCDVGQTEFTPPGTVALTLVDEPVFGPPFCHQKQAESMCFYGNATPAEDPGHYVTCLQHVFQAYQQMQTPVPLIVNTMGWNQDVGIKLFVDVLHIVNPDLVIQFNVANKSLNFPEITPEFSALQMGWLYNTDPVEEELDPDRKKHELVTVDSMVPARTDSQVRMTPKSQRDLMLLAYMMQNLHSTTTLLTARPKVFDWTKMAFHVVCEGGADDNPVDNLCGSIVALCHADLSQARRTSDKLPLSFDEPPVCDCLGYGLVEGVNQRNLAINLVTPMSRRRLKNVNTLLKGSVTLPDQFFLKQSSLDAVAYVDALEPTLTTPAPRPRTRMPRRN